VSPESLSPEAFSFGMNMLSRGSWQMASPDSVCRTYGNGHTKVKTYQPTVYDEMADGPSLIEIRVNESFTGDIAGEGSARDRGCAQGRVGELCWDRTGARGGGWPERRVPPMSEAPIGDEPVQSRHIV
jgi:hypothetical protein